MLVEHAERELRPTGLLDKDSDYDGMIGEAVMELVRTFADQGHSGYSAHLTLQLFGEVARFKPLTPITSSPDEWMHVEEAAAGDAITWQSRRQPDLFSKNGGKSWYSVEDPRWNRRLRGWWFRRGVRRVGGPAVV